MPRIPVLKKTFVHRSCIIAVLLIFTCFLLVPAINAKESNSLDNLREEYGKVVATVRAGDILADAEVQQLKQFFRTFSSVLEQKILGADDETRLQFEPVRRLINSIQAAEEKKLGPNDDQYKTIKAVFTKISNNPVLAIAEEESIRHPDQAQLAVIQANRGPGATYRLNETVQFGITALQDCFVQVYFLSTPEDGNEGSFLQPLLFQPAPGRSSVSLNSGDTLILGEDGSFVIEPPFGTDIIIALASQEELKNDLPIQQYPVPYPLNMEKLFAGIYGKQAADTLSIHSSFIQSKPGDD